MINNRQSQSNRLDAVHLDNLDSYSELPNAITFQDQTLDLNFTHDYIKNEIKQFDLTMETCITCLPLINPFRNPSALYDTLAKKKIK